MISVLYTVAHIFNNVKDESYPPMSFAMLSPVNTYESVTSLHRGVQMCVFMHSLCPVQEF